MNPIEIVSVNPVGYFVSFCGLSIVLLITIEFIRLYVLQINKGKFYKENFPFELTYTFANNIHRQLDMFYEKNKQYYEETKQKTFRLRAIGVPIYLVTNDVRNIEHILNNVDLYGKKALNSRFHGLLGNGIFNADGNQWFVHRKTSAHLFKLNQFKNSVLETFHRHADIAIRVMKRYSEKKSSFDFHDLIHRFTFESIAHIAFGLDLGCIEDDTVKFPKDFDYCVGEINDSFIDPFWMIKRYFTPKGWEYFRALNRINKYAKKVISERRELINQHNGDSSQINHGRVDLLSLYLDKHINSNDSAGKNDLYMPPTDENLRDVILNMIIAGRDTTAQALSWLFYNITVHRDVQEKCREEIRRVLESYSADEGYLSNNNSSSSKRTDEQDTQDNSDPNQKKLFSLLLENNGNGFISYKVLQQLKYVEAVCMETLRLHPSVPKEAKSANQDDILPDGTKVAAGDMVIFLPWIMGRDPELWGEDCMEFKPERFMNTKTKVSPYIFTAFQAGPRTCLGQNFAILEMKAVVARFLLMFDFSLDQPKESVTYSSSLTLPMKGGLKLSVKPHQW